MALLISYLTGCNMPQLDGETEILSLSFTLDKNRLQSGNNVSGQGALSSGASNPQLLFLAGSSDGQSGNLPNLHATTSLEDARFQKITGLAYDFRTLYVADHQNHVIKKINLANNQVSVFAGSSQTGDLLSAFASGQNTAVVGGSDVPIDDNTKLNITSPTGVMVDADYVYFISHGGRISRLRKDLSPTKIKDVFFAGSDQPADDTSNYHTLTQNMGYILHNEIKLNQPADIAYNSGYVYVVDTKNSSVKRISLYFDVSSRKEVIIFTAPAIDSWQNIAAIAFLNNDLYIADSATHKIYRFKKPANLMAYNQIVYASEYVAGSGSISASTGSIRQAGTSYITSMFADSNNLYAVANDLAGKIQILNFNEDEVKFLEYDFSPALPHAPISGFNHPTKMVHDFFNNLIYIAESGKFRILKINF